MNLDNIRAALFDFDDTLCVHTMRPYSSALSPEEYSEAVLSGGNPWPYGVAPNVMQQFVAMCHARAIHMGLLSATSTYTRAEAKQAWVTSHYGVVMKNYCVGLNGPKVMVLKEVARHFNLHYTQVLFVDDALENLEAAAREGFIACSPMECVYFIEQYEACTDTKGA